MNTEEKLEQSCMVKERGTQYFKVNYNPEIIVPFLSPCYELVMMIYSCGHFGVVFIGILCVILQGRILGGRRCLQKKKSLRVAMSEYLLFCSAVLCIRAVCT